MMHPIRLTNEFASVELGDARRTARAVALAETLGASPSMSWPSLVDTAGLEAVYRFMSNGAIDFQALLGGHRQETARRCRRHNGVVLCIHDTTELSFPLHEGVYREHLSRLSSNCQGFYLHASLAVSGNGDRRPLGLLAVRPYVHRSGVAYSEEARKFWNEHHGLFDNESARWPEAVDAAEDTLHTVADNKEDSRQRVVHIADREGDTYEFFVQMSSAHREFVVRVGQNRAVQLDDDQEGETGRMFSAVEEASFFDQTRTVSLGARQPHRFTSETKRHPPRANREATLSFRCRPMTVRRPRGRTDLNHLPAAVDVTVVEAVERHPPAGQTPVRWLLVTTERCDAIGDVLRVVDWYRTRWFIEEYFKAVKTGCRYEERQFGSAHALLNMLSTTLVVAMQMLELRYLSRHAPDAPADTFFSTQQLRMLAALLPKANIPPDICIRDALLAVARLGGHLRRNGAPGWLTLYRGYTRLRDAEAGWRAMQTLNEM